MHIAPFAVEQWMNAYETRCRYNLAETCVASLTVAELLALAGQNERALDALLPVQMTYGAIEGSDRLRDAIAGLYLRQTRANVLVTHGTIGANALVHRTLVAPGDRVVAIVPTYQQHYSIPESIGAEVRRVTLRAEDGYLPDLDALRAAAEEGAKLIALTNPNNPTGALIPPAKMQDIVQIARDANAWLLCDEVYRGTDQEGAGISPSVADLYEKGISTAGMSKAFALAGLRLGWIAGPEDLLAQVAHHRDYDTISVGVIDDHLAAIALEAKERVLERSRAITRGNLAILSEWVVGEPRISWVRPASATVTLLSYDVDMPSEVFCKRLLDEEGVLLMPGSAFDQEGTVRIGYANHESVLRDGLARVSAFLERV